MEERAEKSDRDVRAAQAEVAKQKEAGRQQAARIAELEVCHHSSPVLCIIYGVVESMQKRLASLSLTFCQPVLTQSPSHNWLSVRKAMLQTAFVA